MSQTYDASLARSATDKSYRQAELKEFDEQLRRMKDRMEWAQRQQKRDQERIITMRAKDKELKDVQDKKAKEAKMTEEFLHDLFALNPEWEERKRRVYQVCLSPLQNFLSFKPYTAKSTTREGQSKAAFFPSMIYQNQASWSDSIGCRICNLTMVSNSGKINAKRSTYFMTHEVLSTYIERSCLCHRLLESVPTAMLHCRRGQVPSR